MQIAFGAPLASPSSSAALVNFPIDTFYRSLSLRSPLTTLRSLAFTIPRPFFADFPRDIFYPLAIACNRRGDVV